MTDITVRYAGLATIQGMTEVGIAWIREFVVYEPYQGNPADGILSEPGYASDIVEVARQDGLNVDEEI
mgnify:CR=1 FL=1